MADHDHAYKLLFSHPEMVRDLLEGFVKEPWLEQLDYGSLERVPSTYVSDDLRERSDDVVWRVRWGENWVYIYLLLEFQATVEHYMAVRLHVYVGLLYQDLIKGKQLGPSRLLPPVLAIVLTQPEQDSLRRAFVVWIKRVILGRTPGTVDERVEDLVAMGTLLEARMKQWEQEWLRQGLEQGREQGLEQGREQGLREGEARMLRRQLQRRFGELPDWVPARLSNAEPEQLERWAERLLEVESLTALFGSDAI